MILDSEDRILRAVRASAARAERSAREQSRATFAQLEALLWLRDELRLERSLPPTRGWAASPDLLLELVRRIDSTRPRIVVELGSGVSSVVIGASLRRSSSGRLISLEHEVGHAAATRAELARHHLSSIAEVVDAPLVDVDIQGQTWRWYGAPSAGLPRDIDLLLVDGPPGPTGPLARYPALPMLYERLAPGGSLLVDDGARPDEREMVARWTHEYPDFEAVELPLEKGAWLLTRKG